MAIAGADLRNQLTIRDKDVVIDRHAQQQRPTREPTRRGVLAG
jgi:hypothetical protein